MLFFKLSTTNSCLFIIVICLITTIVNVSLWKYLFDNEDHQFLFSFSSDINKGKLFKSSFKDLKGFFVSNVAISKTSSQTTPPATIPNIGNKSDVVAKQKSNIPERFLIDISNDTSTMNERETSDGVPDASTLKIDFVELPGRDNCDSEPQVIIEIKSAFNNFIKRRIVRNTWARTLKAECSVKVVFLLGLPKLNEKEENLSNFSNECKTERDIIQGSFIDAYTNLTIKSLMGLRWVNEYYKKFSYVLLLDDDMFLDVKSIFTYLKDAHISTSNSIHCGNKLVTNAKVQRKGKWATPYSRYNYKRYPPYCNGACFAFSQDVASNLYLTSLRTHTDIGVDDAMISGILREKIGAEIKSSSITFCRHPLKSDRFEK